MRNAKEGLADAFVVANIDGLSRSVPDVGQIFEDAREEGRSAVVLDPNIDTTSANGDLSLTS